MCLKWKEAATVILTSLRSGKGQSGFNYNVFGIKRSVKTSFMPGTHVFPGGARETSDGSRKWLDIFSTCDVKVNVDIEGEGLPPMLKASDGEIPKIISLKIAAIRETFEETGVLLCRAKDGGGDSNWISSFSADDLSEWRVKVHNNAWEFLNVCREYKCCPDVNALHLWSNWFTPTRKSKRFDTLFFIASLSNEPGTVADESEVDEIIWRTPEELLEENRRDLIILPPPQLYELSRLLNFTDCNRLVSFARERAVKGCERWMPLYVKATDGDVSLLPGDDAYNPKTFEGFNTPVEEIGMTRSEFQSKSRILHRFEGKRIVTRNYSPRYNHVLPISLPLVSKM